MDKSFRSNPKFVRKSVNETLSDDSFKGELYNRNEDIKCIMNNDSDTINYEFKIKNNDESLNSNDRKKRPNSKVKFHIYTSSTSKEDWPSKSKGEDSPKRMLGRKPKKLGKQLEHPFSKPKQHSKNSCDNIRRKLKTHYIRFIINFLNSLIKLEWNGVQHKRFKTIDYSFTKKMSISENQQIFTLKINEYLATPISKKFKFSHNQNKEIVDYLIKSKLERFGNIFNMTLSEFYDKVYLGLPNKIREEYGISNDASNTTQHKRSVLMFFDEYVIKIHDNEPKLAQKTLVLGKELTWLYSKTIGGIKPTKFYTIN